MIPGLAINLRTSISQVEPFFEYIDFLMVMTMDSGYGGTNGLASASPIMTASARPGRRCLRARSCGWTAPWTKPR